ncbi:c-type cytochrome [Pseudoalteromonas sp. Hal099]
MSKMKALIVGAGISLAASFSFNAAAADGEALYTQKMCQTCHGAEGKAPIMGAYPKINGQNKDYLVAQMKDIKSGARSNGMTAAMKAMVATVTDEELEAIADYLSKGKIKHRV